MQRRDLLIGGLAVAGSAAARPLGQTAPPYGPAPLPGTTRPPGADDSGRIVRLKDDLSGDWQKMTATQWDDDPRHHRAPCGPDGCRKFGYEGATMFARDGRYYLGVVDRYEGRYSFRIWVSDAPTGPWREPHEGAPCCGGGNIVRDRQGRWWQTFFGNDDASHFREKPRIVRIDFDARGHVIVHRDQPFLIKDAA